MARNKKDIKQTQIGIPKNSEKEDYLVALRSKNNNQATRLRQLHKNTKRTA